MATMESSHLLILTLWGAIRTASHGAGKRNWGTDSNSQEAPRPPQPPASLPWLPVNSFLLPPHPPTSFWFCSWSIQCLILTQTLPQSSPTLTYQFKALTLSIPQVACGLSASSPALHKPAPLSFSRSFYHCSLWDELGASHPRAPTALGLSGNPSFTVPIQSPQGPGGMRPPLHAPHTLRPPSGQEVFTNICWMNKYVWAPLVHVII